MENPSRAIVITKLTLISAALIFAVFGVLAFSPNYRKASANASGPPASHTGAPGEQNCTVCHADFPVNSGKGNIVISGVPATYQPGLEVLVTVTVNDADAVIYGFEITAIDAQGAPAGIFTLPNQNPAQTQLLSGFVDPNLRRYVEHTAAGTIPTEFFTKSWTFTWTAPGQDAGPISFFAAGNGANSDGDSSGDRIYTTSVSSVFANTNGSTRFDFDGDAKSDLGIFRPAPGEWWYLKSSDGGNGAFQFGASSDIIAPADFTGDGKTDIAFFRPGAAPGANNWFILRSEDSTFYAFPFGVSTDIPAPGDFDGDGMADPAVFRPSNATWYYVRSSDGGSPAIQFGLTGDVPIVEDYDGDGTDDLAVFRPSAAEWYLQRSTAGFVGFQFGTPGNTTPAPADFTGDGKADIAFFNPSAPGGSDNWFVLRSEDSSFFAFPFGLGTDIPVPGDYNGDGDAEAAVFRPSSNTWFLSETQNGSTAISFGISGDIPVQSAYIP